MAKYILKRILIAIIMLFFLTLVFYIIMRSLPSSFVDQKAAELAGGSNNNKTYDEIKRQLEQQYGLDTNVFHGFFVWFSHAIRGDFGISWYFQDSVLSIFSEVIWNSFFLALIAFVLSVIIAIPFGIIAAKKQNTKTDYTISVIALIGISVPTFFVATLLQYVFAVKLQWLPLQGTTSNIISGSFFDKFQDIIWHFVLPSIVLTLASLGSLMRFTRTNMLEVLSADYIRTARAKGLSEKTVVYKHAFRNTLIPLVTILSSMLPSLFSGAMVTETIFVFNGIGNKAYTAIFHADIPFTMFYLSFVAVLILLGNLIADIAYALVDPRVTLK